MLLCILKTFKLPFFFPCHSRLSYSASKRGCIWHRRSRTAHTLQRQRSPTSATHPTVNLQPPASPLLSMAEKQATDVCCGEAQRAPVRARIVLKGKKRNFARSNHTKPWRWGNSRMETARTYMGRAEPVLSSQQIPVLLQDKCSYVQHLWDAALEEGSKNTG